jgi:reactive intermediate/imine deaminase
MTVDPRGRVTVDGDWQERYNISLGIRLGDLVFVSGQTGVHALGHPIEAVDFATQARQALENLGAVLAQAGTSLARVVKVTVFVTDMAHLDTLIQLRQEYFTPPYPADSVVQVAALARPEAMIEIEAVAVVSP